MLLKNNCELCFAFADPKACIFHNKHFSSQNFWCFCCFSFVLSSDYWYVCCAWPNAFVPLRTIAHHWQMNKSQQHLNARETVALIFIFFFFIKTSAILCMGRQIMQSSSSSVMWLGCGSVCGICSMQQQHKKKQHWRTAGHFVTVCTRDKRKIAPNDDDDDDNNSNRNKKQSTTLFHSIK